MYGRSRSHGASILGFVVDSLSTTGVAVVLSGRYEHASVVVSGKWEQVFVGNLCESGLRVMGTVLRQFDLRGVAELPTKGHVIMCCGVVFARWVCSRVVSQLCMNAHTAVRAREC